MTCRCAKRSADVLSMPRPDRIVTDGRAEYERRIRSMPTYYRRVLQYRETERRLAWLRERIRDLRARYDNFPTAPKDGGSAEEG